MGHLTYLSRMLRTSVCVRRKSCGWMAQYFCSSVMNPMSAADTADFSQPEDKKIIVQGSIFSQNYNNRILITILCLTEKNDTANKYT